MILLQLQREEGHLRRTRLAGGGMRVPGREQPEEVLDEPLAPPESIVGRERPENVGQPGRLRELALAEEAPLASSAGQAPRPQLGQQPRPARPHRQSQ